MSCRKHPRAFFGWGDRYEFWSRAQKRAARRRVKRRIRRVEREERRRSDTGATQ